MTENRLTRLENVIETNQRNFYQIGNALRRIRDEKLYRELLFDTFESYVKTRWDMAKSHAYRLIEASNVIDNLSPIGDGVLPENESQTRVLAQLKKSDQRRIWREFISSGTSLTASNIGKFTKMRIQAPGQQSSSSHLIDIISASYKKAVMVMLAQIRLAHNDNWETTSKEAGLFWLRVMKEKILSNVRKETTK
jgi:hypothetical protein